MVQGKLICILGIDGSGKTTQAKKLVQNLSGNNHKIKYVYGRTIPLIPRPFMWLGRKLFLKESDLYSNYEGYSSSKKRLFENRFLSKIYQYVLIYDYLLQVFFKIKIPLMRGVTLVSDRYVYDTIITDLSVDLNYDDDQLKSLINNLLKIIPHPEIVFLIDLPEEIAFRRKDDVPNEIYLKERRVNYLKAAEWFDMIIIDGSKSINEVACIIFDKTTSKLNA